MGGIPVGHQKLILLQLLNTVNKKEEPTLNKVTFVNGVQIKNKSGKH